MTTLTNSIRHIALPCLVQCACLGALLGSAHAQAGGPFEQTLADTEGNWQFFELQVPEGTLALNIALTGGTGDADVYLRAGERPTETLFECAPFLVGNEEACNVANPAAGVWFVGVRAYTDYADATVKTSWEQPLAPQTPENPTGAPTTMTPAQPPANAPATDWQTQILERHNFYRAQHCAPALVWDEEIAKSAQGWSDGCVFTHDGVAGTGFGENLAGGIVGESGAAPVDMWYAEVKNYNFFQPGFALDTGHFTQLVWKATTRVGCGMSRCPGTLFGWAPEQGDALMYSCRYAAAGNSDNAFQQNVTPAPADGVCQ